MASGSWRAWFGLAGGASLLLFAACGGSDSPDAAGDQSADQDGLTAYVECLAEQGFEVELPSGGPPAGGQGRPTDFPTAFPSGFPTDVPTGQPGGPGGQGGPGGFDGLRPEGVDDETWQAAQEACQSLLPTGGFGPPVGGAEANTAYRNCLADRGIDLPEADNTADPAVAEALAACEVLRPTTPAPTG